MTPTTQLLRVLVAFLWYLRPRRSSVLFLFVFLSRRFHLRFHWLSFSSSSSSSSLDIWTGKKTTPNRRRVLFVVVVAVVVVVVVVQHHLPIGYRV